MPSLEWLAKQVEALLEHVPQARIPEEEEAPVETLPVVPHPDEVI